MSYSMEGQVALVTGGGSGIGKAIARRLATEGAAVVVADLDLENAENVCAAITREGGVAKPFKVDVADAAQVAAMVDFTVEAFERLDMAVNNAGIAGAQKPVAELDLEEWSQVRNVNLDGVFYCLKYELAAMENSGSIVNISSILGTNGFANASAYVAAKHGVVGLTKTAAIEYAKSGIRVNAVGPGFIDTPLISTNLDPAMLEGLVGLHPIGRVGKSDEVAALVTFLLSDEASFITGSYHLVDGAYAAQ